MFHVNGNGNKGSTYFSRRPRGSLHIIAIIFLFSCLVYLLYLNHVLQFELEGLKTELSQSRSKLTSALDELKDVRRESSNMRDSMKTDKEERAVLLQQKEEFRKELKSCNHDFEELSNQNSDLELRIKDMNDEVTDALAQKTALEAANEQHVEALSEKQEQLDEMEKAKEDLTNQLKEVAEESKTNKNKTDNILTTLQNDMLKYHRLKAILQKLGWFDIVNEKRSKQLDQSELQLLQDILGQRSDDSSETLNAGETASNHNSAALAAPKDQAAFQPYDPKRTQESVADPSDSEVEVKEAVLKKLHEIHELQNGIAKESAESIAKLAGIADPGDAEAPVSKDEDQRVEELPQDGSEEEKETMKNISDVINSQHPGQQQAPKPNDEMMRDHSEEEGVIPGERREDPPSSPSDPPPHEEEGADGLEDGAPTNSNLPPPRSVSPNLTAERVRFEHGVDPLNQLNSLKEKKRLRFNEQNDAIEDPLREINGLVRESRSLVEKKTVEEKPWLEPVKNDGEHDDSANQVPGNELRYDSANKVRENESRDDSANDVRENESRDDDEPVIDVDAHRGAEYPNKINEVEIFAKSE